MANPTPNTAGLVPLTSERAREIASLPRAPEPVQTYSVRLYARQVQALKDLSLTGVNASEFVRQALDAALHTPPPPDPSP